MRTIVQMIEIVTTEFYRRTDGGICAAVIASNLTVEETFHFQEYLRRNLINKHKGDFFTYKGQLTQNKGQFIWPVEDREVREEWLSNQHQIEKHNELKQITQECGSKAIIVNGHIQIILTKMDMTPIARRRIEETHHRNISTFDFAHSCITTVGRHKASHIFYIDEDGAIISLKARN